MTVITDKKAFEKATPIFATDAKRLQKLLGALSATERRWAEVAGYDVVKQPAEVRASVGVLTEQHGLYERMRALDYLDFFGRVYALDHNHVHKRSLELMERFGLTDALKKRLGEY